MDRELDYVSLDFRRIGTHHQPLLVSPSSSMGLVRTRTLRLTGYQQCHMQVESGAPLAWVNFSLVSQGIATLEFDGCLDFVSSLQDFEIVCQVFCGPACVQLTQALALLGRDMHTGGNRRAWWLNTFENGLVPSSFDQLMLCGCHACLDCLEADGNLLEDSLLPHDG